MSPLVWWLAAGVGAVLFACAVRGFLVEPWRIQHTVLELTIPGVPPALARARIWFLTDLHMAGWGWRELWIADKLRRYPPDLFLCTGDLLSGPEGEGPVLELLGDLKPPMGCWYVRGNNEVEELPKNSKFLEKLRGLGWSVLMNQHLRVKDAGGGWVIAGVDDPNNELDDLDLALKGAPDLFTILLSHTPETFPQARDRGIPLVLAGHTHGGQVQAPWFGPLWGDTPRTGLAYVAGVFREKASTLVVSRGIGWSLLPLRFLCTPELIELKLIAAPPTGTAAPAPGTDPTRTP